MDGISANRDSKSGSDQWSMQLSISPVVMTKSTDTFDPALEQRASSSAFPGSLELWFGVRNGSNLGGNQSKHWLGTERKLGARSA